MTWLKAGAPPSYRRPDLWTPTGSPGGPRLRRAWRVDPAGFSFFFFRFFLVFFFFSFFFFVLSCGRVGCPRLWLGPRPAGVSRRPPRPGVWSVLFR